MKTVNGEKVQGVANVEIAVRSLIDDNADGFRYIGEATTGTVLSASAWTITRIGSNNPVTIDHAPTNAIWNDRIGLSYS